MLDELGLLAAIQAVHPDKIGFNARGFDRLAGGKEIREAIQAGESPHLIVERWNGARHRFMERRREFLIYPE